MKTLLRRSGILVVLFFIAWWNAAVYLKTVNFIDKWGFDFVDDGLLYFLIVFITVVLNAIAGSGIYCLWIGDD